MSSQQPPIKKRDTDSDEALHAEHADKPRNSSFAGSVASATERARRNVNAKLANPLARYSSAELRQKARVYAMEHSLAEKEDIRAMEIGALLAKNPEKFEEVSRETDMTPGEFDVLKLEFDKRWSQPRLLYLVIVLCSTCAAVQGMGRSSNHYFSHL